MRGDLGGDLDAAGLGPADDLDGAGGRQVADVDAGPDVIGEQHIARDDRLLGDRRPSRPGPARRETTPSFIWAPSVSRGSCACWATTPPKAFTYSRARRMITASSTHLPSSEKTVTPAADSCMARSSASFALQADGGRRRWAGRRSSRAPGRAAGDLLDHTGWCRRPGRCWPWRRRPCSRRSPRRGVPVRTVSGVLAARLAQVGVQVDQARQQHLAVGLDHVGALGGQPGAHLRDGLAVDQDVLRRTAEHLRTTDQDLAHGSYFSSLVRAWVRAGPVAAGAAGRGRPSGWRRRWRPARRRCSGRSQATRR